MEESKMAKTREEELKEVKELIKKHYGSADGGMYFTRNIAGDPMKTIYSGMYFTLDICNCWGYYELFGCTDEEVKEIKEYYKGLEEED